MTLYVGIDLSMRATGLVILDEQANVVLQETIGRTAKERPCKTLEQRIRYYAEVGGVLWDTIEKAAAGRPVRIAMEGYSGHRQGVSDIQAPEMGGIVRMALLRVFPPATEVPPSVLKQFATGKGNAVKDVVMKEVLRRWDFNTDDNNVADAYVLARMVRAHHEGDDALTVPQAKAMSTVFGG